jgi:hypothetical protein
MSIPYVDIAPSADRVRERPDGTLGRWMRVYAEFGYDDRVVRQDPEGFYALITAELIPGSLLAPNEDPVPSVTTEDWGREGGSHAFDATGTTDDTGHYYMRYEWDWGDGSKRTVTSEAVVDHVFETWGEFTVTLTVHDLEGGEASTQVTVRILPDPRPGEGGLPDGGGLPGEVPRVIPRSMP